MLTATLTVTLFAVAAEPPTFGKDVAPLLRERCLKCHSGAKARGDLRLTSRAAMLEGGTTGPAVRPGEPAASPLFTHVRDGKMPPKQPLTTQEIEILRRWVADGAKWDGGDLKAATEDAARAGSDWWSLRPVLRPAVPVVKAQKLVRTPIDAFLLARLEAKGLTFSPPADRAALLRRVTYDLIGLAPTPDEVDAFVADARPDAYERVVDRLLASPHHGERYARHWLDVVRFAESHGYEMNTLRPNAWPYRDYVIRALNADLEYRRFVAEQLVGDASGAATGFLVAGPHDMVGNATVEGKRQQRADDLADVVGTTSAVFLGLTVGCARCHDHKFDPISQKDFYAIQALIAGVEHADRPLPQVEDPNRDRRVADLLAQIQRQERRQDDDPPAKAGKKRPGVNSRRNVERFDLIEARFVRFLVTATTDGLEPCVDELEVYGPRGENLAAASRGVKLSASSVYPGSDIHRLEHLNDGVVGNSRSWISAEPGKGWVTLELPSRAAIDRVVWGRDREERFRDRLAKDYRVEVSDDGKAWREVAGSRDRDAPQRAPAETAELKALRAEVAKLREPPKVYSGMFRKPDVVHRLHRGEVMQEREVMAPAGLGSVRPALAVAADASDRERRQALAAWLGHAEHPLTSRVLVNRLWLWHFGRGLVGTPNDFGYNGERPTHPELLDWLASEFDGGSLKRLHRQIVLSTAYRQAGKFDEKSAAIDADNRLLWRATPRRLEAEAIRDALLQASGSLDTTMGGPGYHLWEYSGYVIVFEPKAKLGPAEFRRMVYQFKPRLQQDGTFGVFDCPDATGSAPRRNTSTTALQALNLLNDPFIDDQAGRFAARVRGDVGEDGGRQVDRAFRLAFGRSPTADERAGAAALVGRHGLAALCRALVNANEFVFVH